MEDPGPGLITKPHCDYVIRVTHHVTLQLRRRSFFSHLKTRSLLPDGGTEARNAAPASGGKHPGMGGLLPLLLLLVPEVCGVLRRYLEAVERQKPARNYAGWLTQSVITVDAAAVLLLLLACILLL